MRHPGVRASTLAPVIFPLRTDAPVYHRPRATIGIIAVNVAVMWWTLGADGADVAPLALRYGEWKPWQWVTSVFLHADFIHLAVNMLYLWVFGLVVEGKVGWWRFLAVYGTIAVASNLVEQTLLLGADGGSLGASGVIFGLIAIAMVWAPENEVECAVVFFVPAVRTIDITIRDLGLLYVGIELLWAIFGGFSITSEALHLLGFATGLPIGVAMLRRGWVNCEGWDWFSRRDYRASPTHAVRPAQPSPALAPAAQRAASAAPRRPEPPPAERFVALVRRDDVDGALRAHAACSTAERSSVPAAERERLVSALLAAGRVADARPVVQGLLGDDPGNPRMGLIETDLLVRDRRLDEADRVLAGIAPRLEDDAQRAAAAEASAQVASLRAAGALEFGE